MNRKLCWVLPLVVILSLSVSLSAWASEPTELLPAGKPGGSLVAGGKTAHAKKSGKQRPKPVAPQAVQKSVSVTGGVTHGLMR